GQKVADVLLMPFVVNLPVAIGHYGDRRHAFQRSEQRAGVYTGLGSNCHAVFPPWSVVVIGVMRPILPFRLGFGLPIDTAGYTILDFVLWGYTHREFNERAEQERVQCRKW